jgi:predicted unusual protein kinase regulating ubiquinone biosynthesis (AarF/ABC1/UbiB family)
MSEPTGRQRAQFRIGLAAMWARAKQVVTTDPTGSDEDDYVVDEATAHAMAREAGQLKGGMAKVAQLAAYDPSASLRSGRGGVSAAAQRILGQLWDHAPAVSAAAVSGVIEADLGKAPQQLFAHWDPTPIAAASLGQVHAARGHDGIEYVVKVQYPSVAAALTADLQDREFVRKLAGAHVGATLNGAALDALADAVVAELDYRREAESLAMFAAHWADDPVIRIPSVNRELSSQRVLTMSRAKGVTVAELASDGSSEGASVRRQAATALLRFTWGSALRDGVLNADPNPGNFLFDYQRGGDGNAQVWCLDFGCVSKLDAAVQAADRELWWGLMDRDSERASDRFRMGLASAGLLARANSLASNAHRDWERALVEPFTNARFVWDGNYGKRLADTTQQALAHGGLTLPAPLLLLWRQRLGAAAVIGMLASPLDVRTELQALIGNGLKALR